MSADALPQCIFTKHFCTGTYFYSHQEESTRTSKNLSAQLIYNQNRKTIQRYATTHFPDVSRYCGAVYFFLYFRSLSSDWLTVLLVVRKEYHSPFSANFLSLQKDLQLALIIVTEHFGKAKFCVHHLNSKVFCSNILYCCPVNKWSFSSCLKQVFDVRRCF